MARNLIRRLCMAGASALAILMAQGEAYSATNSWSFVVPETVIWTAPNGGFYEMGASGAAGGKADTAGYTKKGGQGASVGGLAYLFAGQQLTIIVGGEGGYKYSSHYNRSNGGGGGGGSFIFYGLPGGIGKQTLMVAAGGGGGATVASAGVNAQPHSTRGGGYRGGANGYGGYSYSGDGGGSGAGVAGAGRNSTGNDCHGAPSILSFSTCETAGGFGGGGGGAYGDPGAGGGGGGYSGGGGGYESGYGGGSSTGRYFDANSWGQSQSKNGVVTIVDVSGAVVPEPSTWAQMAIGFGALGFMGVRRGKLKKATA